MLLLPIVATMTVLPHSPPQRKVPKLDYAAKVGVGGIPLFENGGGSKGATR
jgi:hypothetical protein